MKLKITLLITTFLVLAGQVLASIFGWYMNLYGFDKIMHSLGGFWAASIILLAFGIYHKQLQKKQIDVDLKTVVLSVLLIGILWEFYEIIIGSLSAELYNVSIQLNGGFWDSLGDILFDTAGAIAASLLIAKEAGYTDKSRLYKS